MGTLFMITESEVHFVKEVMQELAALADPSEFLGDEIAEAYTILDKILGYDLSQVINIYSQLQELTQNDDR